MKFVLGNWQKINTDRVCFGRQYGAFNITKSGLIKTMKLVHRSGSIKCNPNYQDSYWGCRNKLLYGNNGLLTIITNKKKEAILPPAGNLQAHNSCMNIKHFYSLKGTSHKSPELVFGDLPDKVSVSRNQELQIWYGQDLKGCNEKDNNGKTCVDVYAWYQ